MNSRFMYSKVMLLMGRNSDVPGLFAFHRLKAKRPGSVVGSCARPSCSVRFPRRVISTSTSACFSTGLPATVSSSPGSGCMFHMSRK